VSENITYEHPLNERIRAFLRLDHLFRQAERYLPCQDEWSSRVAVSSLLDIVNIFARADLKTEMLKELERQSGTLHKLGHQPGVDQRRLDDILNQFDEATASIHATAGQIGRAARENAFLKSVMHRSSIPGGTCAFDLPQYHYWLQKPHEERRRDLERWLQEFLPIERANTLVLTIIRESNHPTDETATGGFFQQTLDAQSPVQLIRVGVPACAPYFAEISGGKHRFTVRFMLPNEIERPQQIQDDAPFKLSCCQL